MPNEVIDSMIQQHHGADPLRLRLWAKGTNLNVIELSAEGHPSISRTQKNAVPDSFSFAISLDWDSGWREFSQNWNRVLNIPNLTAGQIANSDFNVSLTPTFLRCGTIVESGSVQVWFNGPKIERDFSIPPQQISHFPILICLPITSSNAVKQPQK